MAAAKPDQVYLPSQTENKQRSLHTCAQFHFLHLSPTHPEIAFLTTSITPVTSAEAPVWSLTATVPVTLNAH